MVALPVPAVSSNVVRWQDLSSSLKRALVPPLTGYVPAAYLEG